MTKTSNLKRICKNTKIKVGDRVKAIGNNDETDWRDNYTGVVYHIIGNSISIDRDDGESGSGYEDTWIAHRNDTYADNGGDSGELFLIRETLKDIITGL